MPYALQVKLLLSFTLTLSLFLVQEIVYQSLQRNVQCSSSRSSSNHDHGQSSSKLVCSDFQLAADEALARELEELENQLSATSFGDIRTQAGKEFSGH